MMESLSNLAKSYHQQAHDSVAQGQLDEAIAACHHALKLQPNFAAVYQTLGEIFKTQGKLDTAIRAYWKLLELKPNTIEAYLNLGNLYFQKQNFELAIVQYQKVVEMNPELAIAYWNLGQAWYQCRQPHQTLAAWQRCFEINPQELAADQLLNLAVSLQINQQEKLAIFLYEKLLQIQPNSPEAYCNLGALFADQEKLETAIIYYQKAIQIQPNFAKAYHNLGTLFGKQEQWQQAITCYKTATQIEPSYAKAYYNLGHALAKQGQLDEAIQCFHRAIKVQPNYPGAYYNLGIILLKQDQQEAALSYLQNAITLQPDYAEAYYNLGVVKAQQEQWQDAISAYQKAIELQPHYAEAYCNLGIALQQQGGELKSQQLNLVLDSFSKALRLNPELTEVHQSLLNLLKVSWTTNFTPLRQAADQYLQGCATKFKMMAAAGWISVYLKSGLTQLACEKLLEIENLVFQQPDSLSSQDFATLYKEILFGIFYVRDNPDANKKLYTTVADHYLQTSAKLPPSLLSFCYQEQHPKSPDSNPPLKIGFISSHFRRHSVGWCCADVLYEFSQITPHLYFYATGNLKPDNRTQQFQKIAKKFYIPSKKIDKIAPAIIEEIINDKLDILIDLDSITVGVHVDILAAKPTPICISWLGYDAPFISEKNYFLGDWHTHPPGTETGYREQVLRMPDSFMALAGFEIDTAYVEDWQKMIASLPFIASFTQTKTPGNSHNNKPVVYLCVAPAHKFTLEMVKAQVTILSQVPGSILLRKGSGDLAITTSMYQQECQHQKVDFNRIKFLERTQTEEQHRGIYLLADVLLDSYPYCGGTHTLEALWFNVPLVTIAGKQFLSRMGYSCLKTLGIEAGIAANWEEYIDWGIQLGNNEDLRNSIKAKLIQSKQPQTLSPLWNPKKLAQEMYTLFQKISCR